MLPLGLINQYMCKLNNWSLEIDSIVKDFTFPDFDSAVEFVNKVKGVCEEKGHYPGVLINRNVVRLTLTTHEEKGLTSLDFEVAELIDKI